MADDVGDHGERRGRSQKTNAVTAAETAIDIPNRSVAAAGCLRTRRDDRRLGAAGEMAHRRPVPARDRHARAWARGGPRQAEVSLWA